MPHYDFKTNKWDWIEEINKYKNKRKISKKEFLSDELKFSEVNLSENGIGSKGNIGNAQKIGINKKNIIIYFAYPHNENAIMEYEIKNIDSIMVSYENKENNIHETNITIKSKSNESGLKWYCAPPELLIKMLKPFLIAEKVILEKQ